jgi:hypothetical protein
MVADESGMKISALGSSSEPENPMPAGADGTDLTQMAIHFDSTGNQKTVVEAPNAHDGRKPSRRQPRFDTRRTADYLSERGRLPAEALHLITRRTLAEAIAYIRKCVPGASHDWAANYYLRCVELLLPYTAIKLSDLDTAGGLDGFHSLVAGHFLAASAFSARTTLEAPSGSGARPSDSRQLFDGGKPLAQAGVQGAHAMPHATESAAGTSIITLPPRGRD